MICKNSYSRLLIFLVKYQIISTKTWQQLSISGQNWEKKNPRSAETLENMAPSKPLFQTKNIDIFLMSSQKHIFGVLIY